ncbi:MAG: DUF4832 domain-containing protein [Armatimonadota bacterium]
MGNVGVAPCYRRYPLAVQLYSPRQERVLWQATTGADLTKWLPGRHEFRCRLALPTDVRRGRYDFRLAFLDPATNAPRIRLAITGLQVDGWYRVSSVEVTRG